MRSPYHNVVDRSSFRVQFLFSGLTGISLFMSNLQRHEADVWQPANGSMVVPRALGKLGRLLKIRYT